MNDDIIKWNEGLSTRPDVDVLLKVFVVDSIKPGLWRVTDEEIKKHLGRCDGDRFYRICSAWRKRLNRDHRVLIYRQESVGYYCPTPDEVAGTVQPTLASAGRKLKKKFVEVTHVVPKNEQQRLVQEHQARLLQAAHRDLKKVRMNTLPSTKPVDQVRIEPPKAAK